MITGDKYKSSIVLRTPRRLYGVTIVIELVNIMVLLNISIAGYNSEVLFLRFVVLVIR